jgi:hypothetical protein
MMVMMFEQSLGLDMKYAEYSRVSRNSAVKACLWISSFRLYLGDLQSKNGPEGDLQPRYGNIGNQDHRKSLNDMCNWLLDHAS